MFGSSKGHGKINSANSHSLSIPDRTSSNGNPINVCFEIEYKFSGVGIKSGTLEIIPFPALAPNVPISEILSVMLLVRPGDAITPFLYSKVIAATL